MNSIRLLGFLCWTFTIELNEFIFFWSKQKSESLTTFFCVAAMVNIMRIDHSFQVFALPFYPPSYALMNDNIMEDEIEYSVACNASGQCKKVDIKGDKSGVTKDPDSGSTKYQDEKVVAFQSVVMLCVM